MLINATMKTMIALSAVMGWALMACGSTADGAGKDETSIVGNDVAITVAASTDTQDELGVARWQHDVGAPIVGYDANDNPVVQYDWRKDDANGLTMYLLHVNESTGRMVVRAHPYEVLETSLDNPKMTRVLQLLSKDFGAAAPSPTDRNDVESEGIRPLDEPSLPPLVEPSCEQLTKTFFDDLGRYKRTCDNYRAIVGMCKEGKGDGVVGGSVFDPSLPNPSLNLGCNEDTYRQVDAACAPGKGPQSAGRASEKAQELQCPQWSFSQGGAQ